MQEKQNEVMEITTETIDTICELDGVIKEYDKKLNLLKQMVKRKAEKSNVTEYYGTSGNKVTVGIHVMSDMPVKDYVKTCQELSISQDRWLPTLKVLVGAAKKLIGTASAENITNVTTNLYGKIYIKRGK